MNITPKANAEDLAGVFGLLSFLADPVKCKARLEELQAAAGIADRQIEAASAAMTTATEYQAKALKAQEASMAVAQNADAAKAAAEAFKTDLDTRAAALALAEKAHTANVATLASKQADYDTALADLVAQKKELKSAQVQLKIDQDAIEANKELLAKLSAFKG